MKRWRLVLLVAALASVISAEPLSEWKEYDNALVGIHVRVKRAWTEIALKETPETGSVSFNISRSPHVSITISHDKIPYSFSDYLSDELLSQIYEPGYRKSGPVTLAGRKAIKVSGVAKDREARRQDAYLFDRKPFLDQIVFSAPADDWAATAEPEFAELRKTLRWTR